MLPITDEMLAAIVLIGWPAVVIVACLMVPPLEIAQ